MQLDLVQGLYSAVQFNCKWLLILAERVRFELTSPVKGCRFSSVACQSVAQLSRSQTLTFPLVV